MTIWMKRELAFVTIMTMLIFAPFTFAQTPAPNPFTPKSSTAKNDTPKQSDQMSITRRAVVVFAPGERAVTANQQSGYHIFVNLDGEQGFHVRGVGPKTAGIYDAEFPSASAALVIIHEYHPGSADPAKRDITYQLRIVSEYNHEPPPTKFSTSYTIDGRRLLIYYISGTKSEIHALAVDNSTKKETRFTAAVPNGLDISKLGFGIYDFLITPNPDKTQTLNVYVTGRDGTLTVYSLNITSTESHGD
jgi:hypothetical protein